MATYTLDHDTQIILVKNSTITNGQKVESVGQIRHLGDNKFKVEFSTEEVIKLKNTKQFVPQDGASNSDEANYVVEMIFTNIFDEYVFVVVTDLYRDSLYVLSRYQKPSLEAYKQIMDYVIANYDRNRLVQTPHFC